MEWEQDHVVQELVSDWCSMEMGVVQIIARNLNRAPLSEKCVYTGEEEEKEKEEK